MSKLTKLNSDIDRSPVSKFANFLRQFVRLNPKKDVKNQEIDNTPELINGKWPKTYKTLLKLHKEMEVQKKLPGAKPYKLRMYDIVIGNNEPTLSPKDRRGPAGLLQQGMQLIQSIKGANKVNEREGMNLRFISPRFMPLMPDKVETNKVEVLSPTVMSFYKDNRTIAPLPDILDSVGMTENDRESILSMLMDVSETTKHVNTAIDILKEINFFDVGPEIMNATERITDAYDNLENSLKQITDAYDNLENSLKQWQKEHLDKKGYAFLEKMQLEKMYRDHGFVNEIDTSDIDDYANYTHEQREMALWSTIEQIAKNITSPDAHRRQKRLGQFPVFYLAPVTLAPFAFAPTYGLSVLGPLIISPFIFSPLIINPSVLSPFVLSPGVAVPLIISPYIFGPFILGPYVMMPFILSPYAISPNVLNPYVLSPLILNPTVISPDILSPQVLGGGVLSPTALSPAVLTETTLMASILSPSFLS
uniref:Uncharacterized protein n=1 Tax=Acrobeloides nanus TaxID=290746 RepID=A0A914E5W2_9BILA